MGWSLGYDKSWKRYIGYGVKAYCDHPDCNEEIDRGLYYVCGGEPYGGENGCGLYFCDDHLLMDWKEFELDNWTEESETYQVCERCCNNEEPFDLKPEHPEWVKYMQENNLRGEE